MRTSRRMMIGLALAATLSGLVSAAAAEPSCPQGKVVGSLGITGLYGAARVWTADWDPRFRTEPRVRGVVPGGPADGRLQPKDIVVAVDGLLITTEEGGRRFANLPPGQDVTLRVRRDGELHDLVLRPVAECKEAPAPALRSPSPAPAPAAATGPGAGTGSAAGPGSAAPTPVPAPRRPTTPPPPAPQAPTVRFGFRLQCQDCGYLKLDQQGWPYWAFPEPPLLDQVEPGSPAAAAGLRPGDRLTHIDGLSLTTPAGGRRLAEVEAGDVVEWTFLRGGQRHTARAVAVGIARPRHQNKSTARRTASNPAEPSPLRFAGRCGDAKVEVRGAPVNVSEDPASGELLIRSEDLLVRIQVPVGARRAAGS